MSKLGKELTGALKEAKKKGLITLKSSSEKNLIALFADSWSALDAYGVLPASLRV